MSGLLVIIRYEQERSSAVYGECTEYFVPDFFRPL